MIDRGWVKTFDVEKTVRVRGSTVPSIVTWYEIAAPGIEKIEGESEFQAPERYPGINITATGNNVITLGDGNVVNIQYKDLHQQLDLLKQAVSDPTPSSGSIRSSRRHAAELGLEVLGSSRGGAGWLERQAGFGLQQVEEHPDPLVFLQHRSLVGCDGSGIVLLQQITNPTRCLVVEADGQNHAGEVLAQSRLIWGDDLRENVRFGHIGCIFHVVSLSQSHSEVEYCRRALASACAPGSLTPSAADVLMIAGEGVVHLDAFEIGGLGVDAFTAQPRRSTKTQGGQTRMGEEYEVTWRRGEHCLTLLP